MEYFKINSFYLSLALWLYVERFSSYTGEFHIQKSICLLRICSILLIAGAVGNLIDRVRLNYVIDFFYFKLIDFPIFNVADCYVVVACIIFAFLILFYYKEDSDFDFLRKQKNRI